MKKLIVAIIFVIPVVSFGQLRVSENGNVSIKSSLSAKSPLSLNGVGDSTYFVHYQGGRNGIYSYSHDPNREWNIGGRFVSEIPTMRKAIGVIGEVIGTPEAQTEEDNGFGSMSSYGVMGIAGYGWYGHNYGVYGKVVGPRDGLAIFGTTGDDYICFDGNYAGAFKGLVGIDGDVEHNGNYNLYGNLNVDGTISGIILDELCENISTNAQTRVSSRTVTERFSGMRAITYFKHGLNRNCHLKPETIKALDSSATMRQQLEKPHYSLSPDLIESEFPELVYKREDGTKGVNYIEMIPLLVQAINELKAELDKQKTDNASRARGTNSDQGSMMHFPDESSNDTKLFQNTPNPFTERTEIRFTLSDDARNAYIYIFDMTGKTLKQIPVDASMRSVTVGGNELSSGIYLYSLVVNGQEIDTKRMILSK